MKSLPNKSHDSQPVSHKKQPHTIEALQAADISWQAGVASSAEYDDIYFSNADGIAETEYVFLQQNNLPQAWLNKQRFCILETGFGTGLNFFCTLAAWFASTDDNAVLHYISVEKHPLTVEDFAQLAQRWPQFAHYIEAIIEQYPPLVSGFHRMSLFNGRVKLLLLFGDAAEQLSRLSCAADVCYLDGFAPSKNQSMWSFAVFTQLARLLKVGASLSTFTAVGDVRRGLQTAGFTMKKAEAFGQKRHMLTGVLEQAIQSPATYNNPPWFQYPITKQSNNTIEADKKTAIVIGAGIAGLTTAIALQQSGWQVTVIEKAASVAAGASGNPAALILPRIAKQQSIDTIFYWRSLFTATNQLKQFKQLGIDTGEQTTDVLSLFGKTQAEMEDLLAAWPSCLLTGLNQQQAIELSAVALNRQTLLLSNAVALTAAAFCNNLFQHYQDLIQFEFNNEVLALEAVDDSWSVKTTAGQFSASKVVICNAYAANRFAQSEYLSLDKIAGQINELTVSTESGASASQQLAAQLKSVVCDRGYMLPYRSNDNQQHLLFGASFRRDTDNNALTEEDLISNLALINQSLGGGQQFIAEDFDYKQGGVSARAMTADRLPIVGAVAKADYYQQHYVDLARGRKPSSYPAADYYPGLYINAGHGSRGFTSSFLSAEIIAALINQSPMPVESDIVQRLHPARFLIKALRQ